MSQQLGRDLLLVLGRGRHCVGRDGRGRGPSSGPMALRSKIAEIQDNTFNVGSTKLFAQFQKSKESVAYYMQREIGSEEGYLTAQEIRIEGVRRRPAARPRVKRHPRRDHPKYTW